MRSNSGNSDRRLAAARAIGEAAALIAPGFGPAGRSAGRRDGTGSSEHADGALAVIERFARDCGADSEEGVGYLADLARAQQAEAGDGVVAAVILAAALVDRALAALAAGADPVRLTIGIEAARDAVLAAVQRQATEVRANAEIAGVVATALFRPDLGALVADAFDKVGKDGVIVVEASAQPGLRLAAGEGVTVDGGLADPDLAAESESGELLLREPLILVTRDDITEVTALATITAHAAAVGRPLVVFAVGGPASLPAGGRGIGADPIVAIVAVPGRPDKRALVLGDIAAVAGAAVVAGLGNGDGASGVGVDGGGGDSGLSSDGGAAAGGGEVADAVSSLGAARRVIVTRDRTLIVGGGGDRAAIAARVISIRAEIEALDSPGQRDQLMKRLAMLAGGSVIVEVGGTAEAASERLADQVRRGLAVARLALDYGLAAGGGAALADAERALDKLPRSVGGGRRGDEAAGARVVLDSLTAPLRQLAANAGVPAALIDKSVKSRREGAGFDLAGPGPAAGQTVPMRPQVVDALPVVTAAVANAAALAIRVVGS